MNTSLYGVNDGVLTGADDSLRFVLAGALSGTVVVVVIIVVVAVVICRRHKSTGSGQQIASSKRY